MVQHLEPLYQSFLGINHFLLESNTVFPLLDFIDAGNYKKALQEVDRVLKKQKDFPCAKVLKSLSLIKLGRHEEGQALLASVIQDCPTDETTLQAISSCYRELGKPQAVCDVYEKAHTKDPTCEEILYNLFMSYVRTGDFKQQQLTSLNLYKLKGKNPYYFWNVMSLYLQALAEKDKEKVLLTLAEKKIEKFMNDKKVESEVEVELYLMILQRQEKYQEMLTVIEGPLGKLLSNHIDFLSRKQGHLYELVGNKKKSLEIFKRLSDSHPDQMEYHKKMIELAIAVDQLDEENQDSSHRNTRFIIDSLRRLTEKSNKKGKYRGPHLAKIGLFYTLRDMKWNDTINFLCSNPVDILHDFFNLFAHKQAFYHDIIYIWEEFPLSHSDIIATFDTRLKSSYPLTNDICRSSEDNMRRLLSFVWTSTLWNHAEYRENNLPFLVQAYSACIDFGSDIPQSDINPSDSFALLAAILSVSNEKVTSKEILASITLLTRVIEKSPSNHSAKLFLIMLLNNIGASNASMAIYNSLDTKYIMTDSLNYIIYGCLNSSASFSHLSSLITSSMKFYTNSSKEMTEFTLSAVKYGSFAKVEEIYQLKEKLTSLCNGIVHVDKLFAQLVFDVSSISDASNILRELKEIPFQNLTSEDSKELPDNRDVRVFINLTLEFQNRLKEWKVWSFKCESIWLKIRALVIQVLTSSFAYLNSPSAQSEETSIPNGVASEVTLDLSQLDSLLSRLGQLLKNNVLPESPRHVLCGPWIPHLISFCKDGHNSTVILLLENLVSFVSQVVKKEGSHFKISDRITKLISSATDQVVGKQIHDVFEMRTYVEEVVNIMEVVSLTSTVLCVMSPQARNRSQAQQKKGKKKWETELSSVLDDITWNSTISTLLDCCNKLKESLTKERQLCLNTKELAAEEWVSKCFSDDPNINCFIDHTYVDKVKTQLYSSYVESLDSLSSLIGKKESLLSTLKI